MTTETWQNHLHKGKMYLKRHDTHSAIKYIKKALDMCPSVERRGMADVLTYLGITFRKLGMSNSALKCFINARRMVKSGHIRKRVDLLVNCYGMIRQNTSDLDDWKAFYAIQLKVYLCSKNSRRLGTIAEKDVIHELIRDGWKELKKAVDLSVLSVSEKSKLFKEKKIYFPLFSSEFDEAADDTVCVDFSRKQRILPDDRCYCGSGMPYKVCCGRTPGVDELVSGIF